MHYADLERKKDPVIERHGKSHENKKETIRDGGCI